MAAYGWVVRVRVRVVTAVSVRGRVVTAARVRVRVVRSVPCAAPARYDQRRRSASRGACTT